MKVVIVGGGGGIGSAVAFCLMHEVSDVDAVLVDSREHMVASHLMDLQDALVLGGARSVRAGTTADAPDADVVVLCASVPPRPNSSRSVFLADNAGLVGPIVEPLVAAGFAGVLIVVTNPVDPLVTWVQQRTGLDRRRVIGYTVNDTLRLRGEVARLLGVPGQDVEAWVVGEHGEAQVPLYSRIRIAGQAVSLSAGTRADVDRYLRTWYARHVALDSGRASTWSTGVGTTRLIGAMAASGQVWPASVVLAGEYDIHGVAVGVPVELGPGGVEQVLCWPLADDEAAALCDAASAVRAAVDTMPR